MLKFVVEALSDVSAEDALGHAMAKTAAYITEDNDVNISIIEMGPRSDGGFRAVVEVRVVPLSVKDTLDVMAADEELLYNYEADAAAQRKKHEDDLKHLIEEHFLSTAGQVPAGLVEALVPALTAARIKNNEIEKVFFNKAKLPDNPEFKHRFKRDPEPDPE